MNRVLFHSLTIPPDQVSTGKLVADIASKFKEKNLNIEILASTPQYRFDSKKISDEGLNKIGKNKYVSNYKDVKITHLSSSKRSFSRVKRFSQWINYHFKSIIYLTRKRKNFDTVFIFSYPPTMNLIAIFTKKLLKKKTIYSIWELYPEIAQKLNELNSNFLLNTFKIVDNFCLRAIDEVVVNSDEMKQYLIDARKIDSKKIAKKLSEYGIGTRPFFWPMHKQKVLKDLGLSKSKNFKNSEYLSKYGFYLPSGLTLKNKEIDYIS